MHHFFSTLLFVLLPLLCLGQNKPSEEAIEAKYLEKYRLPLQDNDKLLAQELKLRKPGRANTFGVALKTNLTTKNEGRWESSKSNDLIWRTRIYSKDAYSLNLAFTEFHLPKSAQLYIYSIDKSEILGPFTHQDNDDHMQLWTPIIESDEIIVELQIDESELEYLSLKIGSVNHDFIGVRNALVSGSCNVDVACGEEDGFPEVEPYRDIINSVGAYTLNGIDQCSGVLVNNTANDCTPYFLTAEHCGVSNSNGASVVVYWNYQNSTCRIPDSAESGQVGDGQRTDFNTGATEVAEFGSTDMSLLLLDDEIRPESNIYAAGWHRSNFMPERTVAIHHPGVEEKRISFDNDSPMYRIDALPNINTGSDTSYVIIEDWDLGTTEGGSSGSPLFDAEGLVIGQLFGGLAACGNDLYDYYGWVGRSWEGGGTPSTALKTWLDPLGLNPKFLNGQSCAAFVSVDQNQFEICNQTTSTISTQISVGGSFESEVQYDITNIPDGLEVNLSQNTASVMDEVTLEISMLDLFSDTTITLVITATENTLSAISEIRIHIFSDNPQITNLISPPNEANDYPSDPILEWSSEGATNYQMQLASDETFTNIIVDESDLNASSLQINNLNPSTTYYWRVMSRNICGNSDWSETFNFTVGDEKCITHQLIIDPIEIPEDPQLTELDFMIGFDVLVSDIHINKIQGTHSWVSDLIVGIANSEGNSSVLMDAPCSDFFNSFQDFNIGFSDESTDLNIQCPPTDERTYKPETPLSNLRFSSSEGIWQFLIEDTAFSDGGFFEYASIEICYYNALNPSMVPLDNVVAACANENISFDFYYHDLELSDFNILTEDGVLLNSIKEEQSEANRATITFNIDDQNLGTGIHPFEFSNNNLSTTVYIEINGIAPTAVALSFPEEDQTISIFDLDQVSWNSGIENESFDYLLSDMADFSNEIIGGSTNNNSFDINTNLEPGTQYYLRIVSNNGCGMIVSEFSFTTAPPSSSTDLGVNEIKIFPNPTSGLLNIISDSPSKINQLDLYDLNGKLILHASDYNSQLDLKELRSGVYILHLQLEESRLVEKIIKE